MAILKTNLKDFLTLYMNYRSKITGDCVSIIDKISDGLEPEEFIYKMSDGSEHTEDMFRTQYEEVK